MSQSKLRSHTDIFFVFCFRFPKARPVVILHRNLLCQHLHEFHLQGR